MKASKNKEFHGKQEVTLMASMKQKLNVVNQWSENFYITGNQFEINVNILEIIEIFYVQFHLLSKE